MRVRKGAYDCLFFVRTCLANKKKLINKKEPIFLKHEENQAKPSN